MDNETQKKEPELPTKKEQAISTKQKEDDFLEYLGFDRSDLNDDGSDLEELKNLGGFQNFNERLKK